MPVKTHRGLVVLRNLASWLTLICLAVIGLASKYVPPHEELQSSLVVTEYKLRKRRYLPLHQLPTTNMEFVMDRALW
jgi:hypothetical protein